MKNIQTKKVSLRLNERVRRHAKNYADKKGVELGEFIIMALKELNHQSEKTWINSLPKGWSLKRKRISSSVNFPTSEIKFIDSMKKAGNYKFEAIVEMAIFNRVPSLRRYARESSALKTISYKCTNRKCNHQEYHIKDSKEVKCTKCNRAMSPKKNADERYYKRTLNNLLKFIQFGSTKVPDISDIDAEIVKRFFINKIIKAGKKIKSCKGMPKNIEFTPIIGEVYPKWSYRNKVIIGYDNKIEIGTVYRTRGDRVYITFESQKEVEIKTRSKNEDDYDEFNIKSNKTEDDGRLLGRVI